MYHIYIRFCKYTLLLLILLFGASIHLSDAIQLNATIQFYPIQFKLTTLFTTGDPRYSRAAPSPPPRRIELSRRIELNRRTELDMNLLIQSTFELSLIVELDMNIYKYIYVLIKPPVG